jgi:hypothetical protein
VVAELRKYLPGWKEYFRLADTPRVFADHAMALWPMELCGP